MQKRKKLFERKKDKVMAFRVPYDLYEIYERKCIEESIRMSETFQTAFIDFLKKSNFNSLPER